MGSMGSDADHKRFAYLHCLLGPPSADDEEQSRSGPSAGVPPRLREVYVAVLCKVGPASVIPSLRYLPADFLEWDDALQTCEDEGMFDAVVWGLDWRGSPKAALNKVATFGKRLSAVVGEIVARGVPAGAGQQLRQNVERLGGGWGEGVGSFVQGSGKKERG